MVVKTVKPAQEERRSSRTLFLRKRTRMTRVEEPDVNKALLAEKKSYLYACRSRILRSMLLIAEHAQLDSSSLGLT